MAPTKTLPLPIAGIFRRQATVSPTATVTVAPIADASSNSNGLSTGGIVGIVIGVVVAILLILWAVKSLTTPTRAPDTDRQGWYDDQEPSYSGHRRHSRSRSRSRPRSHHTHHRHHHHRSSTPRPVVLEEKDVYVPRRPSSTYAYPDTARRSRSQRRSRSNSGAGYYTTNGY